MIILYILASIVIVSVCWVVYMVITAPVGFEDDCGFHYGNPKE